MSNITIYDIAREANVSVSTVSRVLNNTAPVKESTRERIMTLINKYQFQPNALARSLIKKVTGMIGMIMPDITNPFFPEVFRGAENEGKDNGYMFFLCNTAGDHRRESEFLSVLREKRVDGIIFLGGRINLARCQPELAQELNELEGQLPIVLVNGNLPKSSLHRVYTDEALGAELATLHLIDLGHRDIAFIGGSDQTSTTLQKLKAFKRKLGEHRIPFHEEWLLYGDYSLDSGRMMMNRLLDRKQRPSAVFCVNDFMAIGAVKAILEHGLRIPDDISIVGFDDTPLSTAVIPELTTVSQNTNDLGKLAVQVLHRLINKEKAKKLTVLEPKLIIRQSTGQFHNFKKSD